MRAALVAITLALLAGPAVAGPFEDGSAAYDRKDYATAVRLWRLLAEQGDANAQTRLGASYQDGLGVLKDYILAIKWYRLAADQGNRMAQNNLGFMYAYGIGVPKDDVMAYMWLNLSAAGNEDDAAFERDEIAKHMTLDQIAEAQRLSREWKRK